MLCSVNKKRNLNIDLIRILATLMIVTAHITGIIYERPDFFGSIFWWANHIVLSLCRLGVPLFFMISGYLLVDKVRAPLENIKKTFFRLGLPFISFYIISSLFFSYIHDTRPFENIIEKIFAGGDNYLYFLPGLIIIYLINPFIQKATTNITQDELKKITAFFFANSALFTLGAFILSKDGLIRNQTFLYWFLVLPFFLYGGYIKKSEPLEIKFFEKIMIFLPVLVNIAGTYIFQRLYITNENIFFLKIAHYLQSYLGATVIISTINFFKVLISLDLEKIKIERYRFVIIESVRNSFGIYLVHMMILEFFLFRTPLTIDRGPYNPAVMVLLIWLALLTASYMLSFFVRRISLIKSIVGEYRL